MMKIVQLSLILSCVSIAFAAQCRCGVSSVKEPAHRNCYVPTTTERKYPWMRALANPDVRICGGTPATENEYPWMARLVGEANGFLYYCGGSLINDRYVLTAAHCLQNVFKVSAGLGANHVSKVEYIRASKVIIHPKYDPDTVRNDIGLIKLSKRLKFSDKIRPVCLPDSQMAPKGPFTITGWGVTESGSSSEVLMETSVDGYPWNKCNQEWNNRLTSAQFCAGNIGKDSCFGDSGGPLTQKWRGTEHVMGIVSFGVVPCGYTRNGVNTNVASYLDWIRENTRDASYCSS